MDLNKTGDGYIKCTADKSEHIIIEQITKINASNLSLPCMKDRYEENVLFYHIGDNISITEYLKSTVLDFEKLKTLAVNLAEVFLELGQIGFSEKKIPSDINYVFISPNTQQIKVIECPIAEYEERNSYQKIMNSICRKVHSKKAFIIIGYIMEGINSPDFNLGNFLKDLKSTENVSRPKDRNVVQKQVIEKEIIKNTTSYVLCGVLAILMETVAAVIFPYIFKNLGMGEDRYIYSLLFTALLTIIVFIICKAATSKETIESVRNVEPIRQQPVMQMTQKTLINENTIDEKKEPVRPTQSDLDKTGILEEEVEINPVKRQEMYNRNSVPTAYLIDEATNKQYEIRKNYFMIGRSGRCDLAVDSSVVSKEHAQIIYQSGDFYIKDLKSSNFTYLNKAQIEPEELYKIENGSRIGFGNKWYIFKTSL
ncbi:MAG: FHA domain-containing protein [Lachnospiraceae bacterium]|nr:FHA domain-containing protein [Lachnospiraceae bacterium]